MFFFKIFAFVDVIQTTRYSHTSGAEPYDTVAVVAMYLRCVDAEEKTRAAERTALGYQRDAAKVGWFTHRPTVMNRRLNIV